MFPRIPLPVSTPASIAPFFRTEQIGVQLVTNQSVRLLGGNTRRVALAWFETVGLSPVWVAPYSMTGANQGWRIEPMDITVREFLFKDWGAMVSGEWFGWTADFAPSLQRGVEVLWEPNARGLD